MNGWLRRYHQRSRGRVLLVCLPHAGGSATYYRNWHGHLPDWIDVAAVQYPGRQERYGEPCVGDVRALAGGIVEALAGGRQPIALFGHSMGALVAYETALLLRGRLIHLAVSGHPAPSRHRGGTVHRGSDDELVAELNRLGGTEPGVLADPDLRAMALPAVRADFRAAETYRPACGDRLRCRVTSYFGDRDTEVTEDEALAWSEVTTGRFGHRRWPGDHFYLDEHEPALVKDLGIRLAADDPAAMP